jgi:uncharacterized protein
MNASSMADGSAVPSPCVDVCRMNAASGLCEGCARTIDEIGAWSVMSDDDKRAVLRLLPERHAATSATPAERPT